MIPEQPNLFDRPIEPLVNQIEESERLSGTISERFSIFHERNPHIYELVKKIALDLKGRGHKRTGMKFIFERIRWLYAIQTAGDSFKLNNNYTALYARLLMKQEPELEGYFETRISPHK